MKILFWVISSFLLTVEGLHEEHKGMGASVARRIEQQWMRLQRDIHEKHKLKHFHLDP